MKETGIIMSSDHPLKCLDGTKTMTRRTWGLDYINKAPDLWIYVGLFEGVAHFDTKVGCEKAADLVYGICKNLQEIKCPYGQVGDRLWVRETWFNNSFYPQDKENVLYRADGEFHEQVEDYLEGRWSPPRFMPRWASRILLEITGVRVERLQEITSWDIEREGLPYEINRKDEAHEIEDSEVALDWFQRVWDSLNAKRGYGWEANPWVWVISFERSSPENIQHRGLAGQSGVGSTPLYQPPGRV